MKSRRRYGCTFEDGHMKMIMCIVTGEMADGTKVWTECDAERNIKDINKQYTLQVRNNWTEFIRL